MQNEQVIGGISCGQVLERLSAFVDGELPEADKHRLNGHLSACVNCTRFGEQFTAILTSLGHEKKVEASAVDEGIRRLLLKL